MSLRRLVIVGLLVTFALVANAPAGPTSKLARETAELVMRKFGREAAEQGVETLTTKTESLALKHGDDAYRAIEKVGPRAFQLADEAGEQGGAAVKLMARHGDSAAWVVRQPERLALASRLGDDAAEAMIRHGEIAEPLLKSLGEPAAGALARVSSQNARRLAMMADDGELARIGRTKDLMGVVQRYGDQTMEFIWRNKGALAVTAALTAFLSDPQPFLNGTKDLASIAAQHVAAPLASEAGRRTNWTIVALTIIGLLALWFAARAWREPRAAA